MNKQTNYLTKQNKTNKKNNNKQASKNKASKQTHNTNKSSIKLTS